MRVARLAALLVVIGLVAGCVNGAEPQLVPAGTEDEPAPTSGDAPAPASPGTTTSTGPGSAPSPTPNAPGEPASVATPPPPAGWSPGPGTMLRTIVENAIAAGQPVGLPVMPVEELAGVDLSFGEPVDRDVVLRASTIVPADAWAERDGVRVAFPAVAVYEGHLEGDEAALARLTITPQWARGSVRMGDDEHVIRVNMDGNFPASDAASASLASAFPLAVQARPAIDGPDYAEEDCLRPVPPAIAPQVELGRSTAAPLAARIVLDSDAALASSLGADAAAMMIAMLVEADSIYDHELGIRFQLAGVHVTTDAEYYPKPGVKDATGAADYDPFAALSSRWNARADVDRDVVHLFADQDTGFAQAACIGGAGISAYGYSFSPLQWERDYPSFHTRVIAHEFGHLFSAHHHYGNEVEGPLATIMIQGYTPGAKPVFGTLEKSVIRGWAEEHLG